MTVEEQWDEPAPGIDECADALWSVQSFLHGELTEARADEIRAHLMACEHCLDYYDSETIITTLVQRCCTAHEAPSESLRVRVTSLHVV